ncbi:SpaH/EbpB family LPXTG-anchored major pilin [Corynebacterium auris]|uniref:SpaH/EbpB family LPXTG-anchored major pilin n=1 Tax=Corynebacterium auris TaxID=44750 RepID=UPI0025B51420|nr:SpaH/EbpB family LPXTG-anchored major pilin [Corynebacterium auris]WJY67030.1 Fimbrial subunit type 1 precursor [Corynebacterium auris]
MRFVASSRTVAACAAVGIALASSAATAPIAFAQDTPQVPGQPSVPAANIDPSRTGSITINKRLNPTELREATGAVDPQASGAPLQGVTFTATRINRDITTAEGFAALAQMTPATAAENLSPLPADRRTGTTNAAGQVQFEDLSVGAYLVEESITGTVSVGGQEIPAGSVVPGSAFIVFVPFTQQNENNAGTWNYNPVVYPKNTSLTTQKSVVDSSDDQGDNVGDTVEYQIRSTIPAVPQGQTLGQYQIHDRYNPTELGDVTVQSVSISGTNQALTPELHYTVNDTLTQDGRAQKTIDFTAAGLALLAANSGQQVVVNLEADLLAIDEGDGEIVNETQTTGFTREGDTNHEFQTDNQQVRTYLAKLRVVKHVQGNEETRLQGAEFELYQTENCTAEGVADEEPLTVGGARSWTTGADGTFTIDGLHVTDFANNEEAELPSFCLLETEAPAGYARLTQPIEVSLTRAETRVVGQTVPLKSINVANVQSSTPTLPATGGAGVALLLLVGAGIIGGGVYAARRNSAEA